MSSWYRLTRRSVPKWQISSTSRAEMSRFVPRWQEMGNSGGRRRPRPRFVPYRRVVDSRTISSVSSTIERVEPPLMRSSSRLQAEYPMR